MTTRDLTPADLEVLEFERETWRHPGDKDKAILERFRHNVTRYYQRLNHLLDHPQALAYDPQLVNRLRRVRDEKRTTRSSRRNGFSLGTTR